MQATETAGFRTCRFCFQRKGKGPLPGHFVDFLRAFAAFAWGSAGNKNLLLKLLRVFLLYTRENDNTAL